MLPRWEWFSFTPCLLDSHQTSNEMVDCAGTDEIGNNTFCRHTCHRIFLKDWDFPNLLCWSNGMDFKVLPDWSTSWQCAGFITVSPLTN